MTTGRANLLVRRLRASRAGRSLMASLVVATVFQVACASSKHHVYRPYVVDLIMRDSSFDYDHNVRAGRTIFRIRNLGNQVHELVLIRIPESERASLQAILSGPSRRVFPTVAALPSRRPGQSGSFAIDAVAGRYAMVSFVEAPNGVPDYANGMRSEFVVH